MGLSDACITRGAVALGCRGGKIGRHVCGKLTAFRVLAFGEPLFPYPCSRSVHVEITPAIAFCDMDRRR